MKYGFVEHGPEFERTTFPPKECLPPETLVHSLVDRLWSQRWNSQLGCHIFMQSPDVSSGLQKTGDDGRVIVPNRYGLGLQADIGGIWQIVRLPPSLLFALSGQIHEVFALGLVGDIIKIAEVPDVARRRAALAGLDAADLAG